MAKTKQLSNSFSTGGGGAHFEAHVQASFVVLMLSGGYVPCLPCWTISEIKLQGKIDGFETDDLIVFIRNSEDQEQRKFLGQIKHSISITRSDKQFNEVIQAAWKDFNNPQIFTKHKDVIALLTGPLSAIDDHNVKWLLDQAKCTKNAEEFYRNIQQANFSPPKSKEKLSVIEHHLQIANQERKVSKNLVYDFLKHFYILNYDLGKEYGVILSLLHSHISTNQELNSRLIWSRIVDFVQTWNQSAGTITKDKLPEELHELCKPKSFSKIPEDFKTVELNNQIDWSHHPDSSFLALANLIGSWNEKKPNDIEAFSSLLGINYDDTWLNKAREIIQSPISPLTVKNGVWKTINRLELWTTLGSRVLDINLDKFKTLAATILSEPDPSFDLPIDKRFAASIYGKTLKYSKEIRRGVAEGLAIVSNNSDACPYCSVGYSKMISRQVIGNILNSADWVVWGSLNDLLPILAQVAPEEFLTAVENSLCISPSPFDILFNQEGDGISSGNYLTGLLWALECLSWTDNYLVQACMLLGDLAKRDPGGRWANRPINSLVTIFLPWMPQTLASIEKREVAVRTLLKEYPNIAWELIIKLLPNQHQTSSGSYKPKWLITRPEDFKKSLTKQDYWKQITNYANLALDTAGGDPSKLSKLVKFSDKLPKSALEKLISILNSNSTAELPETQRLAIWENIVLLTTKHRRFKNASWTFPEELINQFEKVAEQLTPTDPENLYQHLFNENDLNLYKINDNYKEQRRKLNQQRESAIKEIIQVKGNKSVITFSENVIYPYSVGLAAGNVDNSEIDSFLIPIYLDSKEKTHKDLLMGFIQSRHHTYGWKWVNEFNTSNWTFEQRSRFLAWLPFTNETWKHVSSWLNEDEKSYWSITEANAYETKGALTVAVEKLNKYDRPFKAIKCLAVMQYKKQVIDHDLCINVLLNALNSTEPSFALDRSAVIGLIKYLQNEPSISEEHILAIEWGYLGLLDYHDGAEPINLEKKLSNDSEFFCELIRLIYRSKKDNQTTKKASEEKRNIAINAWNLLDKWKKVPGYGDDNIFNDNLFSTWLSKVKKSCADSGHLEIALLEIGKVLIYSPPDPEGLWIHKTIAGVLNDKDGESMREGYCSGIINSRGVHEIDPSGKPENDLAKKYFDKAESVENFGFHRFAVALKNIANEYKQDAKRIIDKYN